MLRWLLASPAFLINTIRPDWKCRSMKDTITSSFGRAIGEAFLWRMSEGLTKAEERGVRSSPKLRNMYARFVERPLCAVAVGVPEKDFSWAPAV